MRLANSFADHVLVPLELSIAFGSSETEPCIVTFVPTPKVGNKGNLETLFFFDYEGIPPSS